MIDGGGHYLSGQISLPPIHFYNMCTIVEILEDTGKYEEEIASIPDIPNAKATTVSILVLVPLGS